MTGISYTTSVDTNILGALETYLSDLRDIKLSGEGVSELSYYPALRNLLEEVGGGLKPKVRCFMNLKNHGESLSILTPLRIPPRMSRCPRGLCSLNWAVARRPEMVPGGQS